MQGRPLFDKIHRTQYAENRIIKFMLESFYSKQMLESHYLLCLLPINGSDGAIAQSKCFRRHILQNSKALVNILVPFYLLQFGHV